jgi:hypothetical protein
MSEILESVIQGVTSALVARSVGDGVINSGATGNILTLTPPAGQRVRLTHLSTSSAAGNSGGIIISIGGVDINTVIDINGAAPDLGMSIGAYHNYAAGNPPSKNFKSITGGEDEVLIIRMSAGASAKNIYYGYIFGE